MLAFNFVAGLTAFLVKNDESLLFRKLTELNTIHRVLMTGVRWPHVSVLC